MLNKFDKQTDPFKVPENYFADFNANIMDKLPSKEKKGVRKVSLWEKLLPWTAVAAIFFGVILSVGIFDKDISPLKSNGVKNSSTSVSTTAEDEDFLLYMQDEAVSSLYNESLYSEH